MNARKPVTAIVVGAGCQGNTHPCYARYFPNKLKIVGVCEPRDYRRQYIVDLYKIAPEYAFKDWKEAVKLDKFADSVIICTPDRLHKDPAVAFATKCYHVILETPMAVTEADCREIVDTCHRNKTILSVCHVLRYRPWVKKVKEIIDSGAIGDVVNINHVQPVGFYHFAHSFVRGNWHNEADSTFSLLTQCCHDVDLICYWMSPKRCEKVSSFGNLSHFNKNGKPDGAASRCLDCPSKIEQKCPYSAKKIYLDQVEKGHNSWPVNVICDIVDIENVTKALKTGPYGKCVYDTDNDVMSHQVVNMQFEGGATVTLQMVAFTKNVGQREVKIYGTKGELKVKHSDVHVFDFLTRQTVKYMTEDMGSKPDLLSAHAHKPFYTVEAFLDTLMNPNDNKIQTGPDDTLASHMLCFAAERSRIENRVLTLNDHGMYV